MASRRRSAQRMRRSGFQPAKSARLAPGRLLAPLRRRLIILLVLLVGLSSVPWFVGQGIEARLQGSAREVDQAGSLRYRLLAVAMMVGQPRPDLSRSRDRLERLVEEQQGVLAALVDGDPQRNLRPCGSTDVCERLRAHQLNLERRIAPLAEGALEGRVLDARRLEAAVLEEFERTDATVHALANAVDAEVQGVERLGKLASVGSMGVVLLVLFPVVGVFTRIRRLRDAVDTPYLGEVTDQERRGADELADLAAVLGDAVGDLLRRTEADRTALLRSRQQREAMTRFARELHRWLAEGGSMTALLHRAATDLGFDGAWLEVYQEGSPPTRIEAGAGGGDERAANDLRTVVETSLGWTDERLGVLGMLSRAPVPDLTDVQAPLHVIGELLALALVSRQCQERARSSEQVAALGGMSRVLAHEVRNPLNSMKLHAELLRRRVLKEGAPLEQDVDKHLSVLQMELKRLDGMVSDYVALGPGAPLQAQTVDLRDLLSRVTHVYRPEADARGIELRVEVTEEPAVVDVDAVRIQQVLHNLFRNAIEVLEGRDHSRIEVHLRAAGEAILVSVRDNGPGFSDRQKAFAPGYTTKSCGTGMGLPLSRRVVELHGGTLRALEDPGGGAVLVLSLPRSRDVQAPSHSTDPPRRASLCGEDV
jgi:signal transduction histidine kinase